MAGMMGFTTHRRSASTLKSISTQIIVIFKVIYTPDLLHTVPSGLKLEEICRTDVQIWYESRSLGPGLTPVDPDSFDSLKIYVSTKRNRKSPRPKDCNTPLSPKPTIAPPGALNDHPADWRLWLPLSAVVLAVSGWLLFFRLGHYPFWDDEASTALYARGIALTGDTMCLQGHNLYAYRNGTSLRNLHGRFEPPVPNYLIAPFVGPDGTGSLWPRVPFATCGLLSVAFMLFWMSRSQLTTAYWIAFSIGLLGNVEFFLYCRQCRYYPLSFFLSIVIIYFYLNWKGRWSGIILDVAGFPSIALDALSALRRIIRRAGLRLPAF